MGEAGGVQSLMGKTGYWAERPLYDAMWSQIYAGRRCRRAQRRTGVLKAVKMVLSARDSLPWIALQSVVSVLAASVRATTAYYRASVLENFVSGGGWGGFRVAAQALLCVELIDTLLQLLVSFLRARGQVKMAQELRTPRTPLPASHTTPLPTSHPTRTQVLPQPPNPLAGGSRGAAAQVSCSSRRSSRRTCTTGRPKRGRGTR
jgi:hypothetical protein